MSVKTFSPYQLFINNVYPTTDQWGKLKYYTMVTWSSPSAQIHKTWLSTRALVCRSVFSSSPPGCRSSASSRSCRAAPWCFAGWAPQCLAGASGRGPRSSRPPSAASTPHRNRANAPVWLLEVIVTSARHTEMILCYGLFSDHTAVQDWTGLELTAALVIDPQRLIVKVKKNKINK